jgi:hypothetical protein
LVTQEIVHSIHSLLPLRDAARAACASRVFLRSWRCYSNLILNDGTLGLNTKKTLEERAVKLVDKFNQIIENHYRNGVEVKTLDLSLFPYKDSSASYLDRWIQITAKSGIVKLNLKMYTHGGKLLQLPLLSFVS